MSRRRTPQTAGRENSMSQETPPLPAGPSLSNEEIDHIAGPVDLPHTECDPDIDHDHDPITNDLITAWAERVLAKMNAKEGIESE